MAQRARRKTFIALACALCTGVCLLLYVRGTIWLHSFELWAKDQFIKKPRAELGVNTNLVFIGIDQTSYADVISSEEAVANPLLARLTNSFPWPRDVWAGALEKLANAGAKVVMLDLIFGSPGEADEVLRASLERYRGRVVIGANFFGGNKAVGRTEAILLPSETLLVSSNGALADPRVGFVNFFPDVDDVVRRATFRVIGERGLSPDGSMLSLVARALEAAGEGRLIPSSEDSHLFRFSAPPGIGYKPIPLYQIFLPEYWTNNFGAGAFFKDKFVIIGPAANIFHDEHRTPYPLFSMLGPEIHLNVLAAALGGEFIGETSSGADMALIACLGFVAFLLALAVRGPVRRLVISVVTGLVYVGACWLIFQRADFLCSLATPLISLSTSTLFTFTYDFLLLRMEKQRTRRTLERYVSKDVVREVLDNPQTYLNALGGVRKPVTILFSDVRGFTTMTESADGGQFVGQLNEYFNEMVAIVFRERGSLDKFIGDAVMALWGSMTSNGVERDAQNAVAAALAMRPALARLNVSWRQRGMKEFSFGIGINHGEVIVGNIGSEQKMEVSVIGDPVNLASRLEGLTKEYKLDLLLGESMVPLVQSRFVLRTVDSVQVKGKTKPVHVFTVMADKEAGEQPPPWLARYEEGLQLYRTRKFTEACDAFSECVRAVPEDYLSQLYSKRCQELIINPPGPEWDTVFVMKSK